MIKDKEHRVRSMRSDSKRKSFSLEVTIKAKISRIKFNKGLIPLFVYVILVNSNFGPFEE